MYLSAVIITRSLLYPSHYFPASVIRSPEQMLDLFQSLLAPFRMRLFFFISGYSLPSTAYSWEIVSINGSEHSALALGAVAGVMRWNQWHSERDLSNASNAAYADSTGEFLYRDDHRQHQLVVSVCALSISDKILTAWPRYRSVCTDEWLASVPTPVGRTDPHGSSLSSTVWQH